MSLDEKLRENRHITVLLALAAMGWALYAHVLHGEFCSDDYPIIVHNPAVQSLSHFKEIFLSFNTRFLTGLTFAVNYAIGGLDVTGYHLVNIVLHVLNSFCVYWLVLVTLQTPVLAKGPLKTREYLLAFGAALIFLCHPIQTQGVSFITQRATSLATFFYLTTMILYGLARVKQQRPYRLIAFVTTVLGMLSKDMTFTIPISLLIYEFYFLSRDFKSLEKNLKYWIPFSLTLFVIPTILFLDQQNSALALQRQLVTGNFSWSYFLTEINVLRTYFRLFIWPINQNHDYDYPLAQSLHEPMTLFSVAILSGMAWLVFRMYKKDRLLSFILLWFFITTSVEFWCVVIVQRGVIYEHWIYLPMVGLSILGAHLIFKMVRTEKFYRLAMTGVVIVLSVLTYQRNFVWQNEIIFWEDAAKKSPRKPTVYLGLGAAYARKGYWPKAIAAYERGVAVQPQAAFIYINLGGVYALTGQTQKAIAAFERVIQVNPQHPFAYHNLGLVLLGHGRLGQAKEKFQKARDIYQRQGDRIRFNEVERILKELP